MPSISQANPDEAIDARTALILYGSETGNAQDVAEEVGRVAERHRFATTVLDLDAVQLRELAKATMVVIVISTTGQGEMPQNARRFWKVLLSSALKPGLLRKVTFSSFGIGDSSYARFNVAHRMLYGRLLQLGANVFCERGEGNEQHPEGHSAGFREWLARMKKGMSDHFPLAHGIEPMREDELPPPKWKLDLKDSDSSNGASIRDGKTSTTSAVEEPSQNPIPVNDTYIAHISANNRVTPAHHFQDVRVIDLRVDKTYLYGPGALAVIYPKNFPENVQEFIDLMGWQDFADRPLQIRATSHSTSQQAKHPLCHLALSSTTLTLRWLLENVFDIMSIPRRSYFSNLAYFAEEGTEDEAYQKERLLELANPELIDELWDYTTRPKRTIVEVMMDFTTIKIPWQYAFSVLPIMRGRQFSIASGGRFCQDEEGKTRVQLLVAIVDPPSPIIKYRKRYGVCTRYMAKLKPGQAIRIGLQPGYLDVRPTELEVPVIMIGPGTGLAPMRSMAWQRIAWSDLDRTQRPSGALHGDILFFGCRGEHADFFFREEWDNMAKVEGLAVRTAFSRDEDRPRQYVQDQIRENGAQVYSTITEKNGKIYVCGSSGNMPKGVREAFLDVIMAHGRLTRRKPNCSLIK